MRLDCSSAHLSVPAGFMMVSFPDEAAFTTCCSTDLLILALSAYDMFQSGVQKNWMERGENEVD